MPDYRVVAQTEKGKQIKVRVSASDERDLRKKLNDKKQTLLYYDEIAKYIDSNIEINSQETFLQTDRRAYKIRHLNPQGT